MSPLATTMIPQAQSQSQRQPWRLSERQVLSVWLPQMTDSTDPAQALLQSSTNPGYTRRRPVSARNASADRRSAPKTARPLDRLALWCDRYTPLVAPDGEQGRYQGLFLDITGCGHLFGGDNALMGDLSNRLDGFGLTPFIAGAHTAGAAWALARFGQGKRRQPEGLISRDRLPDALAPLPVQALRLSPTSIESLDRVGLRRVGDLLSMPRAPLTTRFGPEVGLRLDQALGKADETLLPYRAEPKLRLRQSFAEPIGRLEDIEAGLAGLLKLLCDSLSKEHLGARQLELWLHQVDGAVSQLTIGVSEASRDAQHLARLFHDKREDISAGYGIELMILAATKVEPLSPEARALSADLGGRAQDTAALIDRLGNRLSPRAVLKVRPQESHQPERQAPLKSAFSNRAVRAQSGGDKASDQPRPLHLLPCPAPIEAVAPLPDHPPAMIRHDGKQYRVLAAEGPERLTPEWWLQAGSGGASGPDQDLRDYYRLETDTGERFWVFRQGLYQASQTPQWYLQGIFA